MARQVRKSARERGYTSKWEKERKQYLAANPACVTCGAPATVVDHIQPHQGNKKLFWRRSNWQPLCASCHGRKTVRQDGGFGNEVNPNWVPRGACDENGRPIGDRHWWNRNDSGELFIPSGVGRSIPHLTIISGAPASGKSHWVAANAQPGDLIIDLDQIRRDISGEPGRVFSRSITNRALVERNKILRSLANDRKHERVFFIVTAARGELRRDWAARLGASRSVLILTPAHTCLQRVYADPDRAIIQAQQAKAISNWYRSYSPYAGDEIVRLKG